MRYVLVRGDIRRVENVIEVDPSKQGTDEGFIAPAGYFIAASDTLQPQDVMP